MLSIEQDSHFQKTTLCVGGALTLVTTNYQRTSQYIMCNGLRPECYPYNPEDPQRTIVKYVNIMKHGNSSRYAIIFEG